MPMNIITFNSLPKRRLTPEQRDLANRNRRLAEGVSLTTDPSAKKHRAPLTPNASQQAMVAEAVLAVARDRR